MIHAEDILSIFKPTHIKWIITAILFFFHPIDLNFRKLMLFELVALINQFFTGQRYVLFIWLYALLISYILACILCELFSFILKKIQKKPEHPFYEIEK